MLHARQLDSRPARVPNPRSARAATHRRIVKKSKARYTGIWRTTIALGCMLTLLMGYVVLTSNLTGLSYAVAKAQRDRESLLEETMRLDDRIAALRSDDRLATMAARLGMREPQQFAVVHVRAPQVAATNGQSHLAVLPSLAGFFLPAVPRQR